MNANTTRHAPWRQVRRAMTRDEYLSVLECEPATPRQRGAVMGECVRLGLIRRAERLAVLACLLDVDALDSTAELSMGQAGQLINRLRAANGPADLTGSRDDSAGQADDGQGQAAPAGWVTLGMAIASLLVALFGQRGELLKSVEGGDSK